LGIVLAAMEKLLRTDTRTGRFSFGESVTLADICVAGQVIGAQNADCDVSPYSTIRRIFDLFMEMDAFSSAHPRRRADAPPLLPRARSDALSASAY
jgi:maleylpyruvate isomerase